ncbi:MAG TPA: CocE/NonD family hydrolase, partial [Stellaceae bacterium]|nr:CocE/NonD family hydrolase [Stellaceae bacterium]
VVDGQALSLEGLVIRPDRPGRFPLVVMVHGTPGGSGAAFAQAISRQSPVAFNTAAIAFAQRGYAAVAIMRRGFGRSGGVFSEFLQGSCDNRDYLQLARISAGDVTAAVSALRAEPWVDPHRIVLLGLSTGGLAVTAAAATNPAGVVAVLNFAGGHRGTATPDMVCSPDNLVATMGTLGRTARIPALWLYAANDHSFSPDLARRTFSAYSAAGAPAQLRILPAFGADGHTLILYAPAERWLGAVEPFLAGLGLPTAPILALPPLPSLPPPPGALPVCLNVFSDYLSARLETKAFAVTPQGGCGAAFSRTVDDAREGAMRDCAFHAHGGACKLYAIGPYLAPN